jgi:hypothetical protein
MKRLLAPAAVLVTLAVLPSGCRDGRSSTGGPEGTPEIVFRGEEATRIRFGREVERLLLADRYGTLDSIAESLRKPEAKYPDGSWKLRTFYKRGFDISLRNATETEWQSHLRHLKQWKAAAPGSISAPVALAYALASYAWVARGNQVARQVTDEGWRDMRGRLAQARAVLVEARSLPRTCPGWWMAALKVAMGEDWDRPIYEALFREAVQREPTFDSYYEQKAIRLLPRWGGRDGEWEAFADSIAGQAPAPLGDQRYARTIWSTQRYIDANVFEESRASWDRTKQGFEALVTAYPGSLELRSAFAYLAWQAADQPTARLQFIELGPRIDPGVWEDRGQFMEARKWAFTE